MIYSAWGQESEDVAADHNQNLPLPHFRYSYHYQQRQHQQPFQGISSIAADSGRFSDYSLGINKNTGRLQWCAGCKYIKMMAIIPVTLLPILLILFFITRAELAGSGINNNENLTEPQHQHQYQHQQQHHHHHQQQQQQPPPHEDYLSISNSIENIEQDTSKCIAIRYSLSETIDNEESDFFKDVRTSFIPSESLILLPNCPKSNWAMNDLNNENAIVNDNTKIINKGYYRQYYNLYPNRRRRQIGLRNQTLDILNERKSQDPWHINRDTPIITGINNSNSKKETGVTDTPTNDLNDITPAAFHAFWKGGGAPEQIRSTQTEVMLQYMDESVKPCDDFYQYACGNWEKLNPIPKDKASYDTFEMLRENLDSVLQELLISDTELPVAANVNPTNFLDKMKSHVGESITDVEKKTRLKRRILLKSTVLKRVLKQVDSTKRNRRELKHQLDAEQKAKNLYKSCMNSELLESRGITPLLDLLKSLGGWPVLTPDWDPETFDWLNVTAQLKLFNNDIFLVQWIGSDIKNSDENIIQFDQTTLGLPTRDYFLLPSNAVYIEAYVKFMKTVIELLGASKELAETEAQTILDFEIELAKITSASEDRMNVSVLYNKMTLHELGKQIPQINWKRFLTTVLDREISSSQMVVVFAMDYMRSLVVLLAQTDRKTISNYLFWRFVRHRVNNLDERFQEAKQLFYFVLFGREQSPPRWKTCVNQVNSNMGMAVGAMFVRKYFDENSKKDTLDMTFELQQSFRELLNTTEWLDESTRQLAEQKVNAMTLRIGYPDFILAQNELNGKYADLDIDADKYFENTLAVLRHLIRTEQSKLGEPVNKTDWHTAPAVVNAYYSRNKNQIMFPAGILQPPFYHRHFPRSLNYGGIGVVIGHELTHGFDDKGRLFNLHGNMERWWSDSAIEGFHQRAKCLVSQYGNYTVSEVGIPVDGESTQGENIADNGGIKQAFRAYKKWLDLNKNDEELMKNEVLDGIDATNKQLFFLNFAQVWCGAMRPEAIRNKLKTAVHSPGRFRVIGTLSNSEDFATEYNCPLGSPMNPEKKCRVW